VTRDLAVGFLVALVACGLLTACVLAIMRRLPARQTVRDDGPPTHLSKQGTPHMGGVAIVLSVLVAPLLVGLVDRRTMAVAAVILGFALIGFLDDAMKVRRAGGKGWQARYRILCQTGIAIAFALYACKHFGAVVRAGGDTWTWSAWLWIPVCVLAVVGAGNAANLTDGLDGLLAGTGAICAMALCLAAVSYDQPSGAAMAVILSGACVGFLWLNARPARIWMGDTGSLAIGSGLAAIAMVSGLLLPFVIAAGVLIAEALSVVVQVACFKRTGRRVFRMAPVHHHFELAGWPEPVVVRRFWIAGAALAILAVLVAHP
jgi:phospho-N-acetylmuramoyl-pentapeptide-transferase